MAQMEINFMVASREWRNGEENKNQYEGQPETLDNDPAFRSKALQALAPKALRTRVGLVTSGSSVACRVKRAIQRNARFCYHFQVLKLILLGPLALNTARQ